ncbi:MAG TPA: amidohydrolase family protein, partial [Spirosoma sp.]|nr:amidohydrolase family protein [Spirosoma sp.]
KILGDRLFLISDALFASSPGQPGPRAEFSLGEFVVHYESDPNGPGRYVNNEGKLAGSALTLIDCVRVCVEKVGLSLAQALRMATQIPAEIIRMGDQLGTIRPGYVANLVRLDKALMVKEVWTA